MIREYIDKALEKAKYEIIKDEEPYYGEIPVLQGIWVQVKLWRNVGENLRRLSKVGLW